MSHIVLTQEQASILSQATGRVEVRDAEGRVLAFPDALEPGEAEILADAKRRLREPGPRIPSSQVKAHLQKLEEIRQREGMDEAKMLQLLQRMREGEEV